MDCREKSLTRDIYSHFLRENSKAFKIIVHFTDKRAANHRAVKFADKNVTRKRDTDTSSSCPCIP